MRREKKEISSKKIGVGILAAFMAVTFMLGVYTIQEGTVGVVDTFGEYDTEAVYAGLHVKIPFVQGVTVMDTKLQTINYVGFNRIPDEDVGDGVTQRKRISILDSKNLPIGIDVTVQFRPDPSRMSEILSIYGKNYLDKKVNSLNRSSIRDSASGYSAETIAVNRTEMGIAMQTNLTNSYAKIPMFILEKVALRDIILPDVINSKVIAVQEAKQEEQRLTQVEKQAEVNKRIAEINANKTAEVARITASGQANANIEIATGKATAIKLVSTERAAANDRINKTLTPMLVQQNWVQQWNGIQPTHQLASDANMFLNIK